MTQPYVADWYDDCSEWRLLRTLNRMGEEFGISIEDTGAWTVAKALNRMELQVMDKLLMWDSEECETFKHYSAIEKMIDDVEAHYDAKRIYYKKNEDPGPRSEVRELPPLIHPLPYSFVMSYGT
jgi:hypothetical protein